MEDWWMCEDVYKGVHEFMRVELTHQRIIRQNSASSTSLAPLSMQVLFHVQLFQVTPKPKW